MLSREEDSETLDFRLLREALEKKDVTLETAVLCRRLGKSASSRIRYFFHILRQMKNMAESRFIVTDTYCIPVSVLDHAEGQEIMQIWHASAAVKKFGLQTVGKRSGAKRRLAEVMHMHRNYDHVASCSDVTAGFFEEAFGCGKNKIVKLGLPRLDYILTDTEKKRKALEEREPQLANGKKNLLYVPTIRKNGEPDTEGLLAALDTGRWNLVLHRHILDRSNIGEDAVINGVITVEAENVYDLFPVADAIVTDYSALAVEASLAGKPLFFYTYDLDEYREDVGLNVEYSREAVAPYQFRKASGLARALDEPYDFERLRAFSKKYIDIELGDTAGTMADFILERIAGLESGGCSCGGVPERSAVVVGKNYSNILCMVRDLGEAGFGVSVLRIGRGVKNPAHIVSRADPERKSRYVRRYEKCDADASDGGSVAAEKLLEMAPARGKALLVPVDDFSADMIDRNLDTLKERYHVPSAGGRQGVISGLMDKMLQKKLAREAGLGTVPGTIAETADDAGKAAGAVSFPCFVKPARTVDGKKGMIKKCRDMRELRGGLQAAGCSMLVEKYIPVRAEYSLLGFSSPDGIVCPCAIRARCSGSGARKGVALSGETVPAGSLGGAAAGLRRMLGKIRYTGLFDADFIEADDGTMYFTELNLRAGASERVCSACGTDLPAAMAEYFFSGHVPDVRNAEAGKIFASEKLVLEEYLSGGIMADDARRIISGADVCFIRDPADEAPWRDFGRIARAASALRPVYMKYRGKKKNTGKNEE
jgi:CDP-ribitol ribitolphosphotransferase